MQSILKDIFKNKEFERKFSRASLENQIILTTRARIARNISGISFSSTNTGEEKKMILEIVKESFFEKTNNKNKYIFYMISKLSKTQRSYLVEKHILSPEMLLKLQSKALILKYNPQNYNRSVSVLINEEDHLRIQSVLPGLNVHNTYEEIHKIEKILEKKINFSYDRDFGYLTSCPTNLGTALRLSIICHLPAIVVSGKIEEFVKNLAKIGCNIRGFFGENSDVVGNLFQISNQISLGKYEDQVLEEMDAICHNIIDEEKAARDELKVSRPIGVEDSVLRSYGMLKYAKMLTYGEALELLSMIKLGLDTDMIKGVKHFNFYELISLIGESNIVLNSFDELKMDSDEVDKVRADIVRKKILKGSDKNV
jgi:protein arginine kinase